MKRVSYVQSIHRGGRSVASSPMAASTSLVDYASAATSWFGGIRVPATLLVGASFGQIFALAQKTQDTSNLPPLERYVLHAHNAMMLLSFLCSLSTLVISTATSVTILNNKFNHLAASGYDLLKREFEFEFMTCRLGYLSSLLSFLIGATCRILMEYHLLRRERLEGAIAVLLVMTGTISWLFSYVNSTLFCWPHLPAMTWDFLKLVWHRTQWTGHPLAVSSLICFILSVISTGRLALKSRKKYSLKKK